MAQQDVFGLITLVLPKTERVFHFFSTQKSHGFGSFKGATCRSSVQSFNLLNHMLHATVSNLHICKSSYTSHMCNCVSDIEQKNSHICRKRCTHGMFFNGDAWLGLLWISLWGILQVQATRCFSSAKFPKSVDR